MGSWTDFQAHVYACPEEQREAALAVLTDGEPETYNEWGALELDWGSQEHDGTLSLDAPYTDHTFGCGHAPDVAAALVEAAPGISFALWEGPTGEWLGDLYMRTPELGDFTAECDAEGQPVYDHKQIPVLVRKVLDANPGADTDTIVAELDKAMGGPWIAHWKENG